MKFFFNLLMTFFLDKNEKKFYFFISKKFKKYKHDSKKVILVENINNKIHHIPYIYLIHNLVKKHKSKVELYNPNQVFSYKRTLFYFLLKVKKPIFYKIISNLFLANIVTNYSNISAEEEKEKLFIKIKNKQNFFNLKLFGIHFGDVLYDQYLKKFRVPTIDIKSKHFKNFFAKSIENIIFWNDYFKKNQVKSVITTHATYWNAITARIAMHKNIPVYTIDINHGFYLTKKHYNPYKTFLHHKRDFAKYSNQEKKRFREEADKRLKLRMSGKTGVDMRYSAKSSWNKSNSKKNILTKTKKIKILISAHCFFDSPNGMGGTLFPDFYEWIKFLGKMSHCTDYAWYIKTHPDFLPGNIEVIIDLKKYFKNLKILPSNTSHQSIIYSGIDYIFTVHGTVGIEYAYNNKPVVNASINNPNINYNYNINPKNIKEYQKIIENLKDIRIKINKNEVLENYHMILKNKIELKSIYFDNYNEFNQKFEKKLSNLKSDFYEFWMKNLSENRHKLISEKINNFINSKNYSL